MSLSCDVERIIYFKKMSMQSKLRSDVDQDGHQIQFDIREDEEQNVKLNQIVELLLAAGYFRARIKGLSPFDKVVGGMTWCITTCNFDVDVDLLFQENSTIGQKISLTEKIVAVLPRMKCPYRIEPHQIQGLDFIHIFPVVQWLVKKAIETREEMGDYIRAYSISQFNKHHSMPEDVLFKEKKAKSTSSVRTIQHIYRPQRRYRRHTHTQQEIDDEEKRVQSTLLEYGHKRGITMPGKTSQKKAGQKQKADDQDDEHAQEEEKRIAALLSVMSATDGEGRLTASAIGSIVGLQSQHIQQIASQYAQKQAQLGGLSQDSSGQVGGVHHHKRQTASLHKQIQQKKQQLAEVEDNHKEVEEKYQETQQKLAQTEALAEKIAEEFEKLNVLETDENKGVLERLRHLVAMNESLKKQEQQFKQHCKEEMGRLEEDLKKLQSEDGLGDTEDEERRKMIEKQYEADKEKLQKIRLLLARKNREISGLQRKIDEVPSRAELSQYQRRFVELYNQVANTHKETKQFYTLYNTLDDTKLYLNKEVTLLNSIYDTFEQAMSSSESKEQFLKQLEKIVEGVKNNKIKLEKKKQDEKMRRDQFNDQHLNLLEKLRLYFKTVKDFQEECRKNEILLSKLGGRA